MTVTRRTVGVLGGMGPAATLDFMSQVLALSPRGREQEGVRMIVDSDPTIPDRNDAILRGGPSPGPGLAAMAQGLERAGADFLVMACNTAHAFQDAIEGAVAIPFVSMVEAAADRAAALAPGGVAGLLAVEGCLAAGLYQRALAARGVRSVEPEGEGLREMMDLVYAIKAGDVSAAAAARMAAIAGRLQAQGAGVLIAACTEVPLVFRAEASATPLVDASRVLAADVVDYALGRRALPARPNGRAS